MCCAPFFGVALMKHICNLYGWVFCQDFWLPRMREIMPPGAGLSMRRSKGRVSCDSARGVTNKKSGG